MPATLRKVGGGGAYLVLYCALDWIGLIDPLGAVAITPWNPPAGLSFALLLRYGWRFVPAVLVAVAVADVLFHGLSASPVATVASALVIAVGYGAAAAVLRDGLRLSLSLSSHRDLLQLLAVALVATLLVSVTVVAIFAARGLIAWPEFPDAALRFWVGDVIGIAVLTPFLLLLFDRRGRPRPVRPRTVIEYGLQLAAIGLGLWVIFGLEPVDHFEFSYVLFLPLMWIALREGLTGATWGIVATQLGLIVAIQLKGYGGDLVTQFQLLMLAVAACGLFLGAVVDERQRAEASLRDSEARLQTVVSTAPDAILTFDDTGAILSANRAARQMFRLGLRPAAGIGVRSLLPDLAPNGETTGLRLDGTPFVAEVSVGEARVDGRSIRVAVVRDASARKEAEARLKAHEVELAHAARLASTGETAAALAHELNQPLTALIGFARACQELLRSPEGAGERGRQAAIEMIDETVQQAIRAGQIIRGTREFLERGDTRPARVEIAAIFAATLDLVRSEMSQHQVRVVVGIDEPVAPVLGDPIQLEQVLLNLIRNGAEAMASAGTTNRQILLSAAPAADEPDFVTIGVRDSGPGFAPEIADRLFMPFATTKETGMGLGLSISRSIVEAHGGRIWVVPGGCGAEIRFTLPVYAEVQHDESHV